MAKTIGIKKPSAFPAFLLVGLSVALWALIGVAMLGLLRTSKTQPTVVGYILFLLPWPMIAGSCLLSRAAAQKQNYKNVRSLALISIAIFAAYGFWFFSEISSQL
jgi:hypothetical protein